MNLALGERLLNEDNIQAFAFKNLAKTREDPHQESWNSAHIWTVYLYKSWILQLYQKVE